MLLPENDAVDTYVAEQYMSLKNTCH